MQNADGQLPQAVWTADGLLPDSYTPGTRHKIADRGSDLSAHEPVTVEVDAVSFTDVTTGRSDHTFSRTDTTNIAAPSFFQSWRCQYGLDIGNRSGQD